MSIQTRLVLGWFLFLTLSALVGFFFLSDEASLMHRGHELEAPSARFWMGTDMIGRDIFIRMLCGSFVTLGVALTAIGCAAALGILIGACSAYYGSWVDSMLMGLVNAMLCFPTFFLILSVIAIFGPNVFNIALIIGLTSWMGIARLIRAEILTLKEREFVTASRLFGASSLYIIRKHLIPNALRPVIVNVVLGFSSAILVESGLSFLGIGVQPPVPSWGNVLMDGKASLGVAWWMIIFPGIFIFLTVLALNYLGEALQRRLYGHHE